MHTANIYVKHPVDRPLSATDRFYRLDQKQRLDCIPDAGDTLIAVCDEYLEMVDHAYPHKGAVAFDYLALVVMLAGFMYGFFWYAGEDMHSAVRGIEHPFLVLIAGMALLLLPIQLWLMSKEFFVRTHYPIRFERATRSVSVLLRDNTVLRASWDDLFFTCGHIAELDWWEIRGHVLDWDAVTVLKTFVLSCSGESFRNKEPYEGMARPSPSRDPLLRHWEFVRRYMEEGRPAIAPFVERTIPADSRRETLRESFAYCDRRYTHPLARRLLAPFTVIRAILRWLALRSCTIPQWPAQM